MSSFRHLSLLWTLPLAAHGSLFTVGPDYRRPDAPVPHQLRDSAPGAWQPAAPADAEPRGAWWSLFGDRQLDQLEARAGQANQDLLAAAARVDEARAAAGLARAQYWPAVSLDGSSVRSRADILGLGEATSSYHAVSLDAGWEIDLFGRVRRLNEGARAQAQAAAATFESVRLSLAAEVASTYYSLRATDAELSLVRRTAALRRQSRQFIQNRFDGGFASDLDVAQAETELAATEADAAAVAARRATLNDALAVLVGAPAGDFLFGEATAPLPGPPTIPAGLPSALLERRPDIAAAERTLAAANARIGVARAAFFPSIQLTGGAGYGNLDVEQLFRWDSRAWSLGPSVTLPIFQGGRNRANLARSRAAYDEAVATYRQSVLIAFRELQDALTAQRLLAIQSAAQARAVTGSRRAASIAMNRYRSGYVSYLEVVDAERTALQSERAAAQLSGTRLVTAVALVKALGGGWGPASGFGHFR